MRAPRFAKDGLGLLGHPLGADPVGCVEDGGRAAAVVGEEDADVGVEQLGQQIGRHGDAAALQHDRADPGELLAVDDLAGRGARRSGPWRGRGESRAW
jgi:hypothetical protein